jgi:hypothetical protein
MPDSRGLERDFRWQCDDVDRGGHALQFGTGPIKGFAVTLSLGLLANLFTAVFVCKVIFDSALAFRPIQHLSI